MLDNRTERGERLFGVVTLEDARSQALEGNPLGVELNEELRGLNLSKIFVPMDEDSEINGDSLLALAILECREHRVGGHG